MVGDNDGVMIIPSEIIDDVVSECVEMTLFEEYVLEKVNEGSSIIGLYPTTNETTLINFEKWKFKN